MATKADSLVFQEADAIKQFLLGNKRVVAWIADNWERLEGITGPVHKSTVSKALSGMAVVAPVANALDVLFDEIRADPWEWCKPPESIDALTDYAPLTWWFKTLDLKGSIHWSRFERMAKQPLKAEDVEFVQERLNDWRGRLRAACEQFQSDEALVRALHSDEFPEYQCWVQDGDEIRMGHGGFRRRVGNPGLHGRSDEEIGLAWALADATLTLPNIEKAVLTYSKPRAVPNALHPSEPVEPWNGDEFEGVEIDEVAGMQVKHRVCFYWDGQRYLVEDVEPFAFVWDDGWRAPTQDERDLLETGMTVESTTKAQFEAKREQWIESAWASRNANMGLMERVQFPDGIPRSEIEADFQARLDLINDEAAADEQREIARRRIAFMRRLRRRK